jgi:starch synthase
MEKKKILFVSQEITPYLPETEMSVIGRYLPQGIQEKKKEIRAFMPRYGSINERRNMLHEVIRLSGMNLIIDDTDHSLVIKVASIQSARMQVYFIDNEDFFQRKGIVTDENGNFFEDNDERAIFFARGVLETVKKLRWSPDLVHCHGWITSLVPLYLKNAFKEDPLFAKSKVVYSVYNDGFPGSFPKNFAKKIESGRRSRQRFGCCKRKSRFRKPFKTCNQYVRCCKHGTQHYKQRCTRIRKNLRQTVFGVSQHGYIH